MESQLDALFLQLAMAPLAAASARAYWLFPSLLKVPNQSPHIFSEEQQHHQQPGLPGDVSVKNWGEVPRLPFY